MATQPIDAPLEPTPPIEGDGNDNQPRDFETDARLHGWTPKEEFKGDPAKWVDAETFARRADEVMPILRRQNTKLQQRIENLERANKQASEFFSKAEERAYERAKADIMAQQERAFAEGDETAFKRAQQELVKLEKPVVIQKDPKERQQQAQDAFDTWREKNSWYDRGALPAASESEMDARAFADRMTEKHLDKTKDMSPDEFFDFIGNMVQEKYGPRLGSKAATPRRSSPVEPPSGRGVSGRRTFNDLPPEAQAAADRFIRSGLIKTRDDYVKNYPWDDKK